MQCQQFDEKLLDFLYEELEEQEQAAWQAHVDGCPRCRGEVDSLGRVRTAAKGMSMVEPPPAVSAKLLYQASQRAPRGVVVPLLRRLTFHPMYAAAASFLVVGGIVGLLWNSSLHRDAAMHAPVGTEAAQPIDVASPVAGETVNGTNPAAAAPVEKPPPAPIAGLDWDGKLAGDKTRAPTGGAAKMASPSRSQLQWSAHKSARDAVLDLAPSDDSPRAAAPALAKRLAKADTGSSGGYVGLGGAGAASSGALPSNDPFNSVKDSRGRVASPPPPPSMPPAATQQSSDNAEKKEEQRVVASNMREGRPGEFDQQLAHKGGSGAPKSAPAPAASAQQSAPSPRPATAAESVDEPPVEVERLLQRLDQQTATNRCLSADETYRQLKEHFPERLTPRAHFDHARCERVLGRFREARLEFDRLLVDAPSLRGKIEGELSGLSVEESSRRAAEAPRPAHSEKKAAKPRGKARAADSTGAEPGF